MALALYCLALALALALKTSGLGLVLPGLGLGLGLDTVGLVNITGTMLRNTSCRHTLILIVAIVRDRCETTSDSTDWRMAQSHSVSVSCSVEYES